MKILAHGTGQVLYPYSPVVRSRANRTYLGATAGRPNPWPANCGGAPTYSFSKPWLVNFSVRLFSVTVRTT